MKPLRTAIHGVWLAGCERQRRRFETALDRVEEIQRDLLLSTLRRNAGTRIGKRYDFAGIRSVADFHARVPASTHADYERDLAAIAAGEDRVLTSGKVRRFLPTSGSTAATKLVPWTDDLGGEFRRGIDPWLAALYAAEPALRRLKAYWSVSPPGTAPRQSGVLPVGFEDDSAYLGWAGRWLFGLVSVVPGGVAEAAGMEEFRERTLLALLAERDLGLISVWSPVFLTVLLDHFGQHGGRLLERLAAIRPGRAAEIRRALERPAPWREIWPELRVLSCWTHGPSARYAARLAERFPGVWMQGKGLVATEAFVSLPFERDLDPVLAVGSHFFEFVDPATDGVRLAHELTPGSEYRVRVTTGGGLYRYDMGDLVKVTGHLGGAPCLRFVGREGQVSDLCGEKLHGRVVGEAVDSLLDERRVPAGFRMLAPVEVGGRVFYGLFVDADIAEPETFARELDEVLAGNFHYAHCRRLGQLGPVGVFRLEPGAASGAMIYQSVLAARGMKAGEIKPPPLDAGTGWEDRFPGRWIAGRAGTPHGSAPGGLGTGAAIGLISRERQI